MHKKIVFPIISRILLFVSIIMLLPLSIVLYDDINSQEAFAFITTIVIGLILSGIVLQKFKIQKIDYERLNAKDGLAIVGLSWIILSLWGALPLFLSRVVPSFTDAFFEITSGFTTTGASIFSDVESLPRGILFWRSLTHWLGGMGIIVLFIAILPSLGATSSQLYKAETSGLDIENPETQIKSTAKTLWRIYLFLTLFSTILLMLGKMPLFDALCHSFGAIATGGFSTKNASIGAYNAYIQWVIILTMFLGGVNFALYGYLLKKKGKWKIALKNEEFKLYGCIILYLTPIFMLLLKNSGLCLSYFRDSVFQIVSIMTATGFASTDFDVWPNALRFILILLMFIGGCAGSTSGGLKVVRVLLIFKTAYKSLIQSIFTHAVLPVRFNSEALSEKIIKSILTYFILYMMLFAFGTLFLTISDSCDLVTASSASISALSSVGPGLGKVGPMTNYGWMSVPGKWLLAFLMIAGRLELYAILALFIPATWKK